jgi:hypothetical protein
MATTMTTIILDKVGQPIYEGDKFIKIGTTQIFQVLGYKDDGRIRAQEAILNFGGNPYAPPKPYGSTHHLFGPVYLFNPDEIQINKQWSQ